MFEEFLERELSEGRCSLNVKNTAPQKVLIHGHCHQKAAGIMGSVEALLKRIPGVEVELIQSSCCGMAGHFGYQKETLNTSKAMAELSLLPAIRTAMPDTRIIADGISCRHQIADGTPRHAEHVAVFLADYLSNA